MTQKRKMVQRVHLLKDDKKYEKDWVNAENNDLEPT